MRGRRFDTVAWSRRSQFEFFTTFQCPVFSVCADVDVSRVSEQAMAPSGAPFFLAMAHCLLRAVNDIIEFRLRTRGSGVWHYERIHASATVRRTDDTFGFALLPFSRRFRRFARDATSAMNIVSSRTDLDAHEDRDDLVFLSVLPTVRFSSFVHPRHSDKYDSIPKFAVGKVTGSGGRRLMPTSVEVHHAIVDAYHVGLFLQAFQAYLDEPTIFPRQPVRIG